VVEAEAAEPVEEPVEAAELPDEPEPVAEAEPVAVPRVTGFVTVATVFGLSMTNCGVKLVIEVSASSTISRA
jgi:hypothetical protein